MFADKLATSSKCDHLKIYDWTDNMAWSVGFMLHHLLSESYVLQLYTEVHKYGNLIVWWWWSVYVFRKVYSLLLLPVYVCDGW